MSAAPDFNDVSFHGAARALSAYRRNAISFMTKSGVLDTPTLTRLGRIFPEFDCIAPPTELHFYSLHEGLHFLKVTLGALAAAGQRVCALEALNTLADDLLSSPDVRAECFVEETLAPCLHTETSIPVDFTRQIIDILRVRVQRYHPPASSAAFALAMENAAEAAVA